jgi:TrmH family RNA methyltransferase
MVSHQVLTAMSPVREPSGVVALAQLAPSPVERVSGRAPQLLVILVGVQDPGNVGALIRTAEACGATGMVTMNDTASPFGWKALRASMGSALRLPMAVHVEPRALLGDLRARGVRLVGTSAHGGTPLFSSSLTGPTAILLGAEGAGLPPELRTACDVTVTIPMKPPVESLNVATAGALLLFEAARQRSLRADS